MRTNSNYKRNRNRNKNSRNVNNSLNHKSNSFDSAGPDMRVRGSALQVNEKYTALANDAYSSGDRILAESFFQHADHYYRVILSSNGGVDPRRSQNTNLKEKSISDQPKDTEMHKKDLKGKIEEANLEDNKTN